MERQFLPRDINLSRRALWVEILERSENSEIWTPFLQKDSFRNDPFVNRVRGQKLPYLSLKGFSGYKVRYLSPEV